MSCVAIFMDRYTFRGEMEPTCHTSQARPHHQERPTLQVWSAWQVRPALPGAAAPSLCHVPGPNHSLPRVHNLDERD
jgi:hypothetical protein